MPRGLSPSASLFLALAAFTALGSQRVFCPLPLAVCALGFLMSRGDELRQLAAQLSVLAALEDSIAVGLSRVMGPASPGRGAASPVSGSPLVPAAPTVAAASAAAPSPSHEVAASLLRSASLRATSPRTRTRSRSPAPPASQFQRCFWSAWLCRPRGVGTGHGLGHQELPTGPASPAAPLTRCSRSPRCLGRVAALR